jgi:hypothetical protein
MSADEPAFRAGTSRLAVRALLGHVLPIVFVALAAIVVNSDFLARHAIETHEGIDPYARTRQLVVELRAGNVPPQVLPDARLGAGSAFARFYPPAPFSVAAALSAVTGDVVLGVNLSFLLAAVLSGVAMLWSVRRLGGDRWLAAGAAAVYVANPYHVHDAFVRGALGELWAFVWLPIVVAGVWRTFEHRRLDLPLVLGGAGLLLSHTITALLALWVVAVIAVAGVVRHGWRPLGPLAAGGALAVGLAAWFLVPQQADLGDVWASDRSHMGATSAAVDRHRVDLADLVGSWRNGFRGYSDPPQVADGSGDCRVYFCAARDFAVGPIALALPFMIVTLAATRWRRGRDSDRALLTAAGVAAALLLGFVAWPRPFLAVLPDQYGYVQFPWRALAPLAALVAIAWALALRDLRRGGVWLAVVGVAAIAVVPAVQRDGVDRPDQRDQCFAPSDVRAPADPAAAGCFERAGRFDPPAAGDASSRAGRSARGFTTGADYIPRAADPTDPASGVAPAPYVDGPGEVVGWHRTGDGVAVEVAARGTVTVRIPVSAYSFTRLSATRSFERVDAGGLVAVRVGAGRTAIDVSRTRTPADWGGFGITAASLAGVGFVLIRRGTARRAERARLSG